MDTVCDDGDAITFLHAAAMFWCITPLKFESKLSNACFFSNILDKMIEYMHHLYIPIVKSLETFPSLERIRKYGPIPDKIRKGTAKLRKLCLDRDLLVTNRIVFNKIVQLYSMEENYSIFIIIKLRHINDISVSFIKNIIDS